MTHPLQLVRTSLCLPIVLFSLTIAAPATAPRAQQTPTHPTPAQQTPTQQIPAQQIPAQPQVPADPRIAETIEDELARDHAISAQSIQVDVDEGIVTLRGTTTNIQASDRAAAIARSIRGVRAVVELLEVSRAAPIAATDLEAAVQSALRDDPATDAYEVRVQADANGKVQLQGTVQSWAERQLCARVVAGVKGVTHLDNTIAVNHLTTHADPDIVAEIEERLRWNILVDEEHIDVACRDGDVSLSGTVGSATERYRARHLAEVAGVRSVHTEDLNVAHWQRNAMFRRSKYAVRSNDQIAAAVQSALHLDPRVAAEQVTVSVDQGKVTLRGVVDSLKGMRAASEDALHTVGVSRVVTRLRVAPATKRTGADVAAAVQRALERDPYLATGEVSASVHDGVARLFGRVDTNYQRMRADDAASRTSGVIDVENLIAVRDDRFVQFDPQVDETPIYAFSWYRYKPWRSFDSDEEIRERITEELWWSPFVNSGDVEVQVEHGVATLTGEVASRAELLAATDNAFDGGAVWVNNCMRIVVDEDPLIETPSQAGPSK